MRKTLNFEREHEARFDNLKFHRRTLQLRGTLEIRKFAVTIDDAESLIG